MDTFLIKCSEAFELFFFVFQAFLLMTFLSIILELFWAWMTGKIIDRVLDDKKDKCPICKGEKEIKLHNWVKCPKCQKGGNNKKPS
ncbi:hypothetical protein [Sunxiuqinia elliptica]|uniref:Uncharacterized protein n=1 Tax=Sunxiuqinia elliptica TaxID=655355 RepID=A0A4V3BXS4_9BACT|nr:hypothetical protein [Sunxiuqinia elliptica]TDN99958.1 hypothetical protein DET52_106171 [Sunxiuqinia elliptica]TDO57150.1 hypothetical protein DET65_3735 [Sunxiuqinia elliptica]